MGRGAGFGETHFVNFQQFCGIRYQDGNGRVALNSALPASSAFRKLNV